MDSFILENKVSTLPDIIQLVEHEGLDNSHIEEIKGLGIDFCETGYECTPKYLGIHPETMCASYYIGAEWLVEGKYAVVVKPKMNVDFIEMFMCALKFENAAKYFSKFYAIDFDKKPIKTSELNNQITPLIVVHYIGLLKQIMKRGLKKDYVLREENLQSKVKGKIKITHQIKHNIIPKREDRVYCQYQEYTVDSIENRILKKALLFADQYIASLPQTNLSMLKTTISSIKPLFYSISDNIEVHELKSVSNNKIYKEYFEAIRIAKIILRKFNYSIADAKIDSMKEITPAFWIDMSRLYEVYVYSKLNEMYKNRIDFQVDGYRGTKVDFTYVDKLNEKYIIIDTKYKEYYNNSNKRIIEDIRQISAYARDEKILRSMNVKDERLIECLIIYPEKVIADKFIDNNVVIEDACVEYQSFKGLDNLTNSETKIKGFTRFHKLSFPLPIIQHHNAQQSNRDSN